MAQAIRDSFLDLERHRQLLESNIEKLRKSLQHWQTREAEYEGLKEDIAAVGPAPSREKLVSIGCEYDGKLVTPAEVEDILGVKVLRNADQVKNVLDRRIDYVSRNVKALEQQLEAAENKLAQATIISTPEVRNEEGLPLTEIIEELDEEGNVLSGRTETQGRARGQLLEVLEKAGVKGLPKVEDNQPPEGSATDSKVNSEVVKEGEEEEEIHSVSSTLAKKSVRFEEEVKSDAKRQKSWTSNQLEDLNELYKHQEISTKEPPIVPTDESPEDAALRKEMLEYSMSEVGAVVAELDLEEGSDFYDDDDYEDTSSIEDKEDEHGRSTKKVVDEDLRRQMIEIEQRLGARMMQNVGPNPQVQIGDGKTGDVTFPQENIKKALKSAEPSRTKKGVRFAEELDISHTPQPLQAQNPQVKLSSKSPVGDIVERGPPALVPVTTTTPPQNVSRFKSARAAKAPLQASAVIEDGVSSDNGSFSITNGRVLPQNNTPTNSLNGKTIADQIIERQVPITVPPEPDEFDPALLRQEVTNEYHRSRNRMIQKQGGFLKDLDEESDIVPLTEEEGGPKKMSRFKAARLARS
jgi:unconventional prefoldin RPB5 interactor 1